MSDANEMAPRLGGSGELAVSGMEPGFLWENWPFREIVDQGRWGIIFDAYLRNQLRLSGITETATSAVESSYIADFRLTGRLTEYLRRERKMMDDETHVFGFSYGVGVGTTGREGRALFVLDVEHDNRERINRYTRYTFALNGGGGRIWLDRDEFPESFTDGDLFQLAARAYPDFEKIISREKHIGTIESLKDAIVRHPQRQIKRDGFLGERDFWVELPLDGRLGSLLGLEKLLKDSGVFGSDKEWRVSNVVLANLKRYPRGYPVRLGVGLGRADLPDIDEPLQLVLSFGRPGSGGAAVTKLDLLLQTEPGLAKKFLFPRLTNQLLGKMGEEEADELIDKVHSLMVSADIQRAGGVYFELAEEVLRILGGSL